MRKEVGNEAYPGVNYVDPKKFLGPLPNDQVEVGALLKAPDKTLLMQLPDLPHSTGIVYGGLAWAVVKVGDSRGIPAYLMPKGADVLIYAHPKHKDEEKQPSHLPSASAFNNCSETAVNLVVSPKGITRFWKPEGIQAQIRMDRATWDESLRERDAYVAFLEEVGARYEVYSWEEITDEHIREIIEKPEVAFVKK